MLTTSCGEDGIYRGRGYAEIARVLDMTENAVNKRMQKLRKRLKKEREEEEGRKEQQRMEEGAEAGVSIGLAKIRAGKP
jgi:hypothetical protein